MEQNVVTAMELIHTKNMLTDNITTFLDFSGRENKTFFIHK